MLFSAHPAHGMHKTQLSFFVYLLDLGDATSLLCASALCTPRNGSSLTAELGGEVVE